MSKAFGIINFAGNDVQVMVCWIIVRSELFLSSEDTA